MSKKPSNRIGLEQILREIRFQDLEIFEAVARHGSASAASRELRLHPPFVSKSIKRVETAARSIFFQRSKTGLMLTPEGRRFLVFSQNLSKLVSSSPGYDQLEAGRPRRKLLTLVGASYLTNFLLSPAVSELKKSDDSFRFRLVNLGEQQLIASAIKGVFDIAVHTQKLDWPKSWITAAVGKFSWTLCGRSGHPLGSVANEEDVRRYPFVTPILLESGEFRQGQDQCPLPVRERLRGDEAQTADVGIQLVSQSDELIFVPEIMIKERVQQGLLQKISVRQWHPVRETLCLSVQGDQVPQRLFQQLIKTCEKLTL